MALISHFALRPQEALAAQTVDDSNIVHSTQ